MANIKNKKNAFALFALFAIVLLAALLYRPCTVFADDGQNTEDGYTWITTDQGEVVRMEKAGELIDKLRDIRKGFIEDPAPVSIDMDLYTDDEMYYAARVFMFESTEQFCSLKPDKDGFLQGTCDVELQTLGNNRCFIVSCTEDDRNLIAAVEKKINAALSWIPKGASDIKKAQILHDYLVRNCYYYNDSYDKFSDEDNPHAASYLLLHRGAFCSGYAAAYELLCMRAGLKCIIVRSNKLNHAWNMVEIDGKWYNVDVTWDDDMDGSKSAFYDVVDHEYFMKSDSYFTKHGHKTSDKQLRNTVYKVLNDGSTYTYVGKLPTASASWPTYDYPEYGGPNGKIIKVYPPSSFKSFKVTYKGSMVKKKKLKKTKKIKLHQKKYISDYSSGIKAAYKLKSVPSKAKKFIKLTSAGKMTVKKGLKKGTYKIKVRGTFKETKRYRSTSENFTVKIIVK